MAMGEWSILQGFSLLSEMGGLLNFGKKRLDHQIWENLIRYKSKAVTYLLL